MVTKKILDDDSYTSIEPTFTEAEAHNFFTSTYKSTQRSFNKPAWMPKPKEPQIPFVSEVITLEECGNQKKEGYIDTKSTRPNIILCLQKLPRPAQCPSYPVQRMLAHNQQWKQGVLKLLKKTAENDPSSPSNFRPIALTSCVGKLFTSIFKNKWMDYMVSNKYLNTSIQKAFMDGVPGCTEHHVKLLAAIDEACKNTHPSLYAG